MPDEVSIRSTDLIKFEQILNSVATDLATDVKALRVSEIPAIREKLAVIEQRMEGLTPLWARLNELDKRANDLEKSRSFVVGASGAITVVGTILINILVYISQHVKW